MLPLVEGQCIKRPLWIQPLRKPIQNLQYGLRVGETTDPFEKDMILVDQNSIEYQKATYKDEILSTFKAGLRIPRILRDVAWEVFKAEGIDPNKDWKSIEDRLLDEKV